MEVFDILRKKQLILKQITKPAIVQKLIFSPPALGNTGQWDRASLHSASSVKKISSSEKKTVGGYSAMNSCRKQIKVNYKQ